MMVTKVVCAPVYGAIMAALVWWPPSSFVSLSLVFYMPCVCVCVCVCARAQARDKNEVLSWTCVNTHERVRVRACGQSRQLSASAVQPNKLTLISNALP